MTNGLKLMKMNDAFHTEFLKAFQKPLFRVQLGLKIQRRNSIPRPAHLTTLPSLPTLIPYTLPFILPLESIGMATDLSARDIERAKFAFSIYDFEGNDTVDALDLGKVLRALGLFPTEKLVEKLGGQKKKGQKIMKVEEFLAIFSQAKKDKDVGNVEDFKECLKLYDKNEDGTMIYDELKHILASMGEKLETDEVEEIMKDCAVPPDEDGFTPYSIFLDKLMAGPYKDEE